MDEQKMGRESPTSRHPAHPAAEETEQLVVTISAGTREIVKIEKIDKAGKRDELTEEECAKFAGEDELDEIEAGLETVVAPQHLQRQPGRHYLGNRGRNEGLISVLGHQLAAFGVHHQYYPRWSESRDFPFDVSQGRGW